MDNVEKLFGCLLRQIRILRSESIPTAMDESSLYAITTVLCNAVESLLVDTPENEQAELCQKLVAVLNQTEDLPVTLKSAIRGLLNYPSSGDYQDHHECGNNSEWVGAEKFCSFCGRKIEEME